MSNLAIWLWMEEEVSLDTPDNGSMRHGTDTGMILVYCLLGCLCK